MLKACLEGTRPWAPSLQWSRCADSQDCNPALQRCRTKDKRFVNSQLPSKLCNNLARHSLPKEFWTSWGHTVRPSLFIHSTAVHTSYSHSIKSLLLSLEADVVVSGQNESYSLANNFILSLVHFHRSFIAYTSTF